MRENNQALGANWHNNAKSCKSMPKSVVIRHRRKILRHDPDLTTFYNITTLLIAFYEGEVKEANGKPTCQLGQSEWH